MMFAASSCGGGGGGNHRSAPTTSTNALATTTTSTSLVARTDKTASTAPAGAIEVQMRNTEFQPSALTAKAGNVTFFLVNAESPDLPEGDRPLDRTHNLTINGAEGLPLAISDRVAIGEKAAFTVEGLDAGTYKFHCNLPYHAQVGMRGTLEVQPR